MTIARNLSTGRFTGVVTCLSIVLGASPASADVLLGRWESHHEAPKALSLSPEIHNWSSDTNYAPDGSSYIPTTLESYSRFQFDAHASYGFTDWLTVYGRLSWAHVEIRSQNPSDHSGLSDQSVGATIRLWETRKSGQTVPASLEAQLQADLPAYDNSVSQTNLTPFLGNGTTDLTAGGFLTIPVTQSVTQAWTLSGGAGFTSRNKGYSAGLPWSVRLQCLQHFDGWIGSASIGGYQSLGTDPLESTAISGLKPAGSAGSFATGSINPALLDLHGSFGYRFDPKLSVALELDKSFFGKSAPSLFAVGASLTTHWDWGKRSHPLQQTPTEYGKANQGFVSYEFEAKVIKTSDRLNSIKIDKGSGGGVATGQIFDVFVVKPNGETGETIARAQVSAVKQSEASLIILEYFREVWIEEGFVVKRPL